MDEESVATASGTTLDASSAINNDSNSLEAGEIVDDTPPVVGPPEEEVPGAGVSGSGDLEEAGEKTPTAATVTATTSSSEKSGSSSKPVLGKEKAKQRLKAIGIQKRMQMESKQSRPDKVSRKKSHEKNSGGSGSKKDKPPTPHEKAKLTKEEIEKLKEKQDCALPCLYYDAAMIHHIRADFPEKKAPSAALSKAGPCLTASLEAIKNYEDQDEVPEGSDNVKNYVKVPPQGVEPLPGNEHHVQHQHHRVAGPCGEIIRNYKQARRKLFFRGPGDIQHHNFSMRGRDKIIRSRFNPHLRNIRKYQDPNRRLQRELPRLPQILSEGGTMYTKTKPVITFSINTNINKPSPSIIEHKKTRKRSKHKSGINKIKPKKKSRSKSRRDDSKKRSISSVKSKKKKKISSKKDKTDKKDRNRRRSRNKKNHPNKICGALSFHLNEFLPEEDVEVFPLSKDSIEPIEEQDEDDAALENKLKCLQEELNKKSPSPDTDDYMANWEEEEDFAAASVSIDSTPKKPVILAAKVQGQAAVDTVQETTPEGSNTPKIAPLPGDSSTPEKIDHDQFESEMRDGLGTPIYVNPSPPAEMLGVTPGSEEDTTPPPVPPSTRKQVVAVDEEEDDDFEVPKNNGMTPKIPSSPLFGMQVIYEQFIQSVSEAGIELSLSSQPALKKTIDGAEVPPHNATDEEECSFTPNASPTGGKIHENLDDTLPKKVSSSPKSGSSTPTDSSSDTASSTSSTTTTDTSSESPNAEKKPDLLLLSSSSEVKDCENVDNIEKNNLPSILSPEDTQKLRSLHERSRMLKNLQEQSDAMDDEDKQCLLGLEKLIEAEKNLLMRKYDVARDLTDELKLRDPPSPCDSTETPEGVTPPRISVKNLTDPTDELEANKIFDVNREAVKLKFSPKTQKSSSRTVAQTPLEEDDQDFTEKLLKMTAPTPSKDHSEGGERKKRERKFSRSVSRSPEGQKSIRKGRSLSISPTRRSREQWGEKQKRSKRQRHYSPNPSNRKRAGGGDSKKGSRSHRWPLSPLIRKRSRSPYGRRFSRSPPFRPPSPKSPPPRGRSTSPQKERNSRLDSDGGPSAPNYSWSDDSTGNYYPTNESYYYIPSPVQGAVQKPRPSCEPGEFYHPNYRLYNYDYQTMGLYANSYGNEYVGPEPMSSYSRIPVINSAGGNYYYDDFEAADDSHNPQASEHPETNNNHNNIKQVPLDPGSGITTDKKHFVVQKGNVLEIVPTSIIPKIELPDSNSYENETVQIEHSAVVIKSEPEFNQDGDEPLNESGNDRKIEMPIALKVEKNANEKKRKKRKSQDFVLWEDEIAKRHILSAVLRLNKEDDGTLRGILYNKPITEKPREKKRVIFADGIPPGRSSSTSDEDSSPVRLGIPHRLKKRSRRRKGEENKENEVVSLGIDTALIGDCFKVDPELDNLPPPPPPPGDPPAHLPQPVLLKPPSPEQFLYFHFDPVVSSMYISNSPTPMPPRLLTRGVQSNVAPQMGPPPGAPRNSNSINQSNIPVGGNGPIQPIQIAATATAKGCFIIPRELSNEPQICPSPKLGEMQHPPAIVPPLQHPERRFRPQQQQFMPPMMMAVAAAGGGEFRPPSPIIPGFSMFNRPLLRASPGNLNRSDFPVPPPSPQPSQQQQILGHPSIPFGPRPPGGVANFNRNIPPPFIGSQQRGESPSMMSNFQPIQPIQQNVGGMRPSGSVQLFTPNPGGMPGFATPTVALRPPGGMSSPIVGFSNSGFTPPTSPANVKNIPILMGKSSGILPPGGQFSRSNTPMMGGGGDSFIPNSQTILSHHPRPRSGPFNATGMPVQMHRPNLGFPRSFGPPPPPCPQMQQQMFLQQQQGGGAPPQTSVRPMFPSPAGNYPFLRNDGVIPDHQMSPQHPPHPGMPM